MISTTYVAQLFPTLFAFSVVSDADVYLLDDPLAAVDAHVGQHLYERCITALAARGKCVVLVTNAVQFLRGATAIAVVRDGQVGIALPRSGNRSLALFGPRSFPLFTAPSLSLHRTPSLLSPSPLSVSMKVVEYGTYEALHRAGGAFRDMIDTHQDGTTAATSTASAKNSADRAVATASAPSVADATETDQKEGNVRPAGGTHTTTKNEPTASAAAAVVEAPAPSVPASKPVAAAGGGIGGKVAAGAGRLVADEDKGAGDVRREVYAAWLRAAGGLAVGLLLLGCYFGAEGGRRFVRVLFLFLG